MNSSKQIYLPEVYTPLEETLIKELRNKVSHLELKDEDLDDAHLVRWLRARNLDIDKAFEMLEKCIEWRKKNNIEDILEKNGTPLELKDKLPLAYCGVDTNGNPIFIIPVGREDFRGLLEEYGNDIVFRHNLFLSEMIVDVLRKVSKEQGRQVTQVVQIIDLEGYSYGQVTSKLVKFMSHLQTTLDANYPEQLRYALIINAPKIFNVFFNIIKPLLAKRTLEKFDIYGPDPKSWKKVIQERFPVECIPPRWGGTKKGSDIFCSQDDIWVQGPVPISFFTQDEMDSSMTLVTIRARDTFRIDLEVGNENSTITWRFRPKTHDIGFKNYFQKSGCCSI